MLRSALGHASNMISGFILSIFVAAGSAIAGAANIFHPRCPPTAPGPGQTFKEGGDCTLTWNLDTTGKWTSFSVDLMSGSNFAMSTVTNVFKDKDGTKGETSYTWKCPSVTPNSAIYFYQFSQANSDTTWTTRFAISSPSGDLTAPANSTQPGGAQIPWGIGHLTSAGAEAPVTTVTTAPSATANTTALNTPATTTPATNPTNSTVVSSTANTTSTAAGTAGKTPSQTTSSSSSSNTKPSSTFSPTISTPNSGSNNASATTSGAGAITLCKSTAAVLALVAVLIVT
ncbi:hypothetical protein H4Q26_002720 [Puccinia striiformis f. sp. tritici PST-130]|nr:hypothetical protein H4Q26_002720 [Puccinia striiformis f. sp. tritici PST-130]